MLRCRNLGHLEQYRDQAVSVKCCIVLLTQSQRPLLPVGHLFAFANALLENLLRHLGKTNLRRQANLRVVCLNVNKVCEVLEKAHPRQVLAEHIQVVGKRKSDANRVLVHENLSQHLIEAARVGEGNEVDEICVRLVAQLQKCGSHNFKFCHLWPPLTVHSDERLADHLAK